MSFLEKGDIAPDFEVESNKGLIKLQNLLEESKNGVILYFYPRSIGQYCIDEACSFRDNLVSLQSLGYVVVGVSPESVEDLLQFEKKYSLTYYLAADEQRKVIEAYGVSGDENNPNAINGVVRSTFILDKQGKISWVKYNVNVDGHVEELLKQIEKL